MIPLLLGIAHDLGYNWLVAFTRMFRGVCIYREAPQMGQILDEKAHGIHIFLLWKSGHTRAEGERIDPYFRDDTLQSSNQPLGPPARHRNCLLPQW